MMRVAIPLIAAALVAACAQSEHGNETTRAIRTTVDPAPNSSSHPTPAQLHDRNARNGIETRRLGGRAYTITSLGAVPEGDADTALRDLRDAAIAGNAKASYGIYLKVRECVAMVKRYEAQGAGAISPSTYQSCKHLEAGNYEGAASWLDLAASQGHLGAQLLYAADPEATLGGPAEMLRDPDALTRYKETATRYLKDAASGGNVEALLGLANAYRVGVLTDKDLVTSYAYYQAVQKIDPGFVPQASMEVLKKDMSQQQIERSRTKGMEIYDECCGAK